MTDCCSTEPETSSITSKVNSAEPLHIAIIGSGSAAFSAALKALEKGAKVSLIESSEVIGGTCVNIGCVPSKIMIRGAHIAHLQSHHGFDGVPLTTPKIDRKKMLAQQKNWVDQLRYAKYERILEDNSEITLIRGTAKFKNSNTLIITQENDKEIILQADKILLAVGARALIPKIQGLSETPYWTSTNALIAKHIPEKLIILGGAVIALELAQAFSHLGSKVILMARSTLLSKQDAQLGETLNKILSDEGIEIYLHTVPNKIIYNKKQFSVSTEQGNFIADNLLVATGRQSNADRLNLVNAGVRQSEAGSIIIDELMQTSVSGIYAAGDCTSQPQFVYVAAAAGNRAASNMLGDKVAIELSVVPQVVFTTPQVATVGLSEEQAKCAGLLVESRSLDLEHIPRALVNMDTRGFIKLVAEKGSGRIVGCQLVANEGGEIIQIATLAIINKMTINELAGQLFPYLTMSEGLKLCAQTFNKDVTQLSCCAG